MAIGFGRCLTGCGGLWSFPTWGSGGGGRFFFGRQEPEKTKTRNEGGSLSVHHIGGGRGLKGKQKEDQLWQLGSMALQAEESNPG